MNYKSTSIREVIGRVFRNTRVQDASYARDMEEWIPEAMGFMKTKVLVSPRYKDLTVDFHKAKLPCDLKTLSAVAYGCQRMRFNGSVQPYGQRRMEKADTTFTSSVTSTVSTTGSTTRVFTLETTAPNTSVLRLVLADTSTVIINATMAKTDIPGSESNLNTILNQSGIGTFTVSWDGDTLTITVTDTSDVSSIICIPITLDADEVSMSVQSSTITLQSGSSQTEVTSLVSCNCLPYGQHTYYTEMDWLNTSLCDGKVRIFYKALPTDEDGFPLIPDNEDYKEAIYWHCRGRMIGTGYKDTVYDVKYCEEKFWFHAGRAMGQIRYPSVDQVETWVEISTRLILPDDYYETFFANPGKEGMIDM